MIKPYVNNFKINLFEIAYLDREKIDMFKSDFRILADYLYQMRVNKNYVAGDTVIEHVDELLMLMSAMTNDYRFEETINEMKGKEHVTMCEALDRVEARGMEKGIAKGREEGIKEGIKKGIKEGTVQVLISLVKDGILSISDAAKRAGMSVAEFKKYTDR